MKKSFPAGFSVALLCLSGSSHAQSTVTLYGLLDTAVAYVSNSGGHTLIKQASGTLFGNRWGLLGSEDLGGGMKAIFTLENGFNLSNGTLGQNNRMFGRQAFFGLSVAPIGTITLGRQYFVNYVAPLSLNGTFGGGGPATHPYDNDNLDGSLRSNNSVKFESVQGGFKFGGLYGFSNSTNFADSRVYNIGASYAAASLTVAASYFQLNNGGSTTNTAGAVATGDAVLYAGRQRTWTAGVNYQAGPVLLGAVFSQTWLKNGTAIGASAAGATSNFALSDPSARLTNYEVNAHYTLAPQWLLAGAYTFTDAHLNGAYPKYSQITGQIDYLFSKRTDVYLEGVFQHVSNIGNSGITAAIPGFSRSSNGNQALAEIGIRQRF